MPTPVLYLVTVLIWGTSWYAMELQLVLPGELAIAYRFLLAAAMLVGYCLVTGRSLRFTRRDHLFMALQGFFLFSLNYILFYWAAAYLVSGLLAVLFSTITVMNIANGALLFRRRVEPKVALAALLGLIGIGLVFWPELAKVELSRAAAVGLVMSLVATYAASLGNMVTVRHSRALIPVVQANAIGMSYGALFTLVDRGGARRPLRVRVVGQLPGLAVLPSPLRLGVRLRRLPHAGRAHRRRSRRLQRRAVPDRGARHVDVSRRLSVDSAGGYRRRAGAGRQSPRPRAPSAAAAARHFAIASGRRFRQLTAVAARRSAPWPPRNHCSSTPHCRSRPSGRRSKRSKDSRIVEVWKLGFQIPDVIGLWVGEGDLPTPAFICDAAAEALKGGDTFYTHKRGIA